MPCHMSYGVAAACSPVRCVKESRDDRQLSQDLDEVVDAEEVSNDFSTNPALVSRSEQEA